MRKSFEAQKEYHLTCEEVLHIYREVRREYEKEDAKSHFEDLYLDDPEILEDDYGISFGEGISDEMLARYVDKYENIHDCDIDENSLWAEAIESVLSEMSSGSEEKTYCVDVIKTYTFEVTASSRADAQDIACEEADNHDAISVRAIILDN